MKSIVLIAVGVLLGVVVMLAVSQGTPPVVYAGTPSGNGDVNGSGGIDIADAVYILSYLFAQGPVPEAIEIVACDSCCPEPPACDSCCPPCPPPSLPATGQTKCYNTFGTVIDCISPEWPGQDWFYQKGCPMVGRFVDNGDGTVTDNCTGLMWQKDTADINGDGTIVFDQDGLKWQEALQYCEGLEFAGHDDWRLPNVRELQSIVDYGRFAPSIHPIFRAESGSYWSSTTLVSWPHFAWEVVFSDGTFDAVGKDVDHPPYIRAVRG